jgi:hypothetical protein
MFSSCNRILIRDQLHYSRTANLVLAELSLSDTGSHSGRRRYSTSDGLQQRISVVCSTPLYRREIDQAPRGETRRGLERKINQPFDG